MELKNLDLLLKNQVIGTDNKLSTTQISIPENKEGNKHIPVHFQHKVIIQQEPMELKNLDLLLKNQVIGTDNKLSTTQISIPENKEENKLTE